MGQATEFLLCKHEALSLNPNPNKKKKKEKKEEEEKVIEMFITFLFIM
jgi:hypothetical protein